MAQPTHPQVLEGLGSVAAAVEAYRAAYSRRCISGIEATVSTVRRVVARQRCAAAAAMKSVAGTVRTYIGSAHTQLVQTIRGMLLRPVDPTSMEWTVFRLFGREHHEPSWTRWVANLLRATHGPRAAQLMWKAICTAAGASEPARPGTPSRGELLAGDTLAQAEHWRQAADRAGRVEEVFLEVGQARYGNVDIVVRTPEMLAVVENKLWAGWHDWKETDAGPWRQADRYRQIARQMRLGGQRVGLVLVTEADVVRCNGLGHYDVPVDWVVVRWRQISRALRAALAAELDDSSSPARVLELWPLLMTVAAVEKDLVQLPTLDLSLSESPPPAAVVRRLAEFRAYLQGE